jgi:hypothetical protein
MAKAAEGGLVGIRLGRCQLGCSRSTQYTLQLDQVCSAREEGSRRLGFTRGYGALLAYNHS